MNATETITNVLSIGEATEHDGYTMRKAGSIVLGKSTFRVEIQELPEGEVITWLHGARGGAYMLRPVSIFNDSGVQQIISFNSGAPLRVQGNEVRVVMLGNIIEVLP